MMTAESFESGQSQAVRLPKECRSRGDEVLADKIGDMVFLMPKGDRWSGFLNALNPFSDDFTKEGRGETVEQEREEL